MSSYGRRGLVNRLASASSTCPIGYSVDTDVLGWIFTISGISALKWVVFGSMSADVFPVIGLADACGALVQQSYRPLRDCGRIYCGSGRADCPVPANVVVGAMRVSSNSGTTDRGAVFVALLAAYRLESFKISRECSLVLTNSTRFAGGCG